MKLRDPDPVFRHGGAPADAVNAHAGEAGDRRGERGSVGGELDHAATDALVDAGLRAGHPVLPAPEVALRIEHEPPIGVIAAAREAEREGEVVRSLGEIGHEGRTAPGAVLRLRVGFVEQRIERPSASAHGSRAMPAIASSVFLGVAPPGGVAALRKRARQSSLATVAKAVMSEPSVFRFASVVVWVLLSGSRSTLPHLPVAGSTRFGAFPAAIRSPSGFPEIDSPLMNRAAVNAEATVVSSLTVTFFGNVVPSSVISAMASLGPLSAAAFGVPPLATR